MSAVQHLQEQKAALEMEIAMAVKAAEARRKALEAQIAKERAAEVEEGKAEIQKLMARYHLTPKEVFGVSVIPAKKSANAKTGYLAEIRQFYGNKR